MVYLVYSMVWVNLLYVYEPLWPKIQVLTPHFVLGDLSIFTGKRGLRLVDCEAEKRSSPVNHDL